MANQGNTNLITTGPELADVDIVNSYSEIKRDTNYSEVILQKEDTTYVSEVEVQSALNYRDVFKRGDIITALNTFYNSLQSSQFNNQSFSFDTIVYWFQKLKYSNKELISLNSKGSTFGEKILPQLNPAVSKDLKNGFFEGFNLQQSIFNSNAFSSIGQLLGTTQSTIGPLATLADTTIAPQSFFDNISDSIGTLANSKYLQLDSTLPIFDVSQEYYGVPIPYSASTESKISNNTRNIAYNLSRGTTALMRRNLLNVAYTVPANAQNMASDATVAHGLNLINDLPTFTKINIALPTLVSNLASKYTAIPRVFQFIQYLCNIGNQTAANLRDIFPVQPNDRDFVVVSSAERALASNAERKQISDNAVTQSYLQQQGVNYSGQYNTGLAGYALGNSTAVSSGIVTFSNSADKNTNIGRYLDGISFLETTQNVNEANIPNAGNTGFFQLNQSDATRAINAGLPDPRVGTYEQQAAATWQYIQMFKPQAAAAIESGDFNTATNELNNFWVSLPGGSQATQLPSRYTEFTGILQGQSTKYNVTNKTTASLIASK